MEDESQRGDEENIMSSIHSEIRNVIESEKAERSFRDVLKFMGLSNSPGIIFGANKHILYLKRNAAAENLYEYLDEVSMAFYFSTLHGSMLNCVRCINEIFGEWSGNVGKGKIITDHVRDNDGLGKSRAAYASNHNRWRKSFLVQSKGQCSTCGTTSDLELAHITPVEDFFYNYHKGRRLRYPTLKFRGVEKSYRNDNLMVLCKRCHDAQTMSWGIEYALDNPEDFLELIHRRHIVLDAFEQIINQRGWRTAEDLHQQKLPQL